MQGYVIFWLLFAVALGIIEATTVQLVAIWFCIASLGSMVGAMCSLSLVWQIVIFVGVSVLLLFITRPFVKNVLQVRRVKTNADMVEDSEGLVLETINNLMDTGRVEVMGMEWSARSVSGEEIPAGKRVKVLEIQGVKLMVQPLEKQESVQQTPAMVR